MKVVGIFPSLNNIEPRRVIFILVVLTVASMGCHKPPESNPSQPQRIDRHELEIVVEGSGSTEVDTLVKQLVSGRPAPYPDGYWPVPMEFVIGSGYATPEVSNAIVLLKLKGPNIFPYLITHLQDDRYCYSGSVQAVDNYTVGQTILDVLCDGELWGPVYMEGRNTPNGRCGFLTFAEYLKERDESKWAKWAKGKTRLQIQMDFIDWCVAKEEERGFVGDGQKAQLLARYEDFRERMKKKYSQSRSANESR